MKNENKERVWRRQGRRKGAGKSFTGKRKLSQGFKGVKGLLVHLSKGRLLQVEATGSTKALR